MFLFSLITVSNGVNLSLTNQGTLYPGVLVKNYRASSPSTDVTVVEIDLCQSQIHLNATKLSHAGQSVGAWGNQQGLQVAINGDFYRTSPTRVYGDAIGDGVAWPLINTGLHSNYSSEWYFQDFGWIAFGYDWVDYTYTKWVKNNPGQFPTLGGWEPSQVAPDAPDGTIALVSGFPSLVIEGQVYTCSSPTDSSCFPDRADMRDRHPRSAVGLTQDLSTLILVAVDGRTSSNTGMYGAELAETMGILGSHFALNLDGGGSSQLWSKSNGYLNTPSETYRSVANHLGIFAGSSSGKPQRPGHCVASTPCELILPEGGIIDDSSSCFQMFGPSQYWRNESDGLNGSLYWTNAYTQSTPYNWAWWQLNFEEEGEYLVEWYATSAYSIHQNTQYEILADATVYEATIDQSQGDGWTPIGTYHFAQGGRQHIAIFDSGDSNTPSNQKIVADAIRVTRVGGWCGNNICDDTEDCFTCAEDCPPTDEIFGNNIDDDCDGIVDGPSEPSTEIEEDCTEETQIQYCINQSILAQCYDGIYEEYDCTEFGKLCSNTLNSCVDIECIDRENDSFCDNNNAHTCILGSLQTVECEECQDGECIVPDNTSSKNTSGCSIGLGILPCILMFRRQRRTKALKNH